MVEVNAYIFEVLRRLGCTPIIVNGHENHLHPFIRLDRSSSLSRIVSETKVASTIWIKERFPDCSDFQWQRGYAAFSVSPGRIEPTRRYIANQEAHHRNLRYEDELLRLLKAAKAEFDERYLWD